MWVCWTVLSVLLLAGVSSGARVNVNDRPPNSEYRRDQGHYLVRNVLGVAVVETPSSCAARCNVNERCMGFNYQKTRARCTLLSHNKNTNPIASRYRSLANFDHYVRVGARYQCPAGSFPHPYKARCYKIFNTPKTFFEAIGACRADEGSHIAILPNRLTVDAIWHEVQNRLNGDDMWISLIFHQGQADLWRKGAKSPFLWQSNLIRGKPPGERSGCGIALKDSGEFDYIQCTTRRAFICEYRPHSDNEMNELCPHDTALFDGHCYWSTSDTQEPQAAASRCAERGGMLAAFPTFEAITFIGRVWEHIVPDNVNQAWIGLTCSRTDDRWYWGDGNPDVNNLYWASVDEKQDCPAERCTVARRRDNAIQWVSRDCTERHEYMCMGASGEVRSHECPTMTCPIHSVCRESNFEAKCECEPGYVSHLDAGMLSCRMSAVCQASGDPHYTIFDGTLVHYQGLCTHLLAGPCDGQVPTGLPDWNVRVYNVRLEGASDRVAFSHHTDVYIYDNIIRMGIDNLVTLNGIRRSAEMMLRPYSDHRYIRVTPKPAGHNLVLSTDFGLQVEYKRYRVTIQCPVDYHDRMCGICGNMNGDASDADSRHNQVRWRLVQGEDGAECDIDDPYTEGECVPGLEEEARQQCNVVHSMTAFDECRQAEGVDVSTYYDNCVEDACAGEMGGVDDMVCLTIEALVTNCRDKGVNVPMSYRDESGCGLDCMDFSVYRSDMSLNIKTCQNPDGIYDVSLGRGEGCECIEGYIMDGGNCIPKDNCGCLYDDDIYMELGSSIVNDDCTRVSTCEAGSDITVQDMQCGTNTECVVNGEGIRGCECLPSYEGDPLDICHHTDACPYPMPEDYNLDLGTFSLHLAGLAAVKLHKNSLNPGARVALNRAAPLTSDGAVGADTRLSTNAVPRVDPNRPSTIEHMMPGSTLVNPLCQIVTCYVGDNWDESEVQCVPHSSCVPDGEGSFTCVCDTGYTGDGYVECNDGVSGTGDPHFMVTSHSTGQHLCFDAHGFENETWLLIEDPDVGLRVHGRLFETNTSTPEQPQSFFSTMIIQAGGDLVTLERDDITYNDTAAHQWGDNIHLGPLHYVSHDLYEVRVTDDVTLRVSRAHAEGIGHYLGVYVVNSDGLGKCTGIIGQFIKSEFHVESESPADAERQSGVAVFSDGHTPVPVNLAHRYNRAAHGLIDCWVYRTRYGYDTLLGPKDNYTV